MKKVFLFFYKKSKQTGPIRAKVCLLYIQKQYFRIPPSSAVRIKQPPLDLATDGVVNRQMVLLHHKGFGCGDADGDVADLRQFSAALA